MDLGLAMGRSFRVGHGVKGEVVRLALAAKGKGGAGLEVERMKSGGVR